MPIGYSAYARMCAMSFRFECRVRTCSNFGCYPALPDDVMSYSCPLERFRAEALKNVALNFRVLKMIFFDKRMNGSF